VESLAAENLVLRKFESDDVRQFVEAVRESANTVGQWLPWWKADFSEDEARSWFQTCEKAIAARSGFDIGIFHVVLVENRASCQLADKCGAKLECIAENRLVHRGQPAAAAVYSFICE
jgi:RimJ/RimL family protein N-acetyltransferase